MMQSEQISREEQPEYTEQPAQAKQLLRIESLYKEYGSRESKETVLKGVSFDVYAGEFVGIMGPSGSGKTTLLNCIATIIRPTQGLITLQGQEITHLKHGALEDYRGRTIGYLFQNFELIDNLTAKENIMLPLEIHGTPDKEDTRYLQAVVHYLELGDTLNKFPAQLSGGQKQRIAAARALAMKPKLILADEPTGALDSANARKLMEKLAGLNKDASATILMVTHDAAVASFCSRILFIKDGQIFHELRKRQPEETRQTFYERILGVTAQMGGGKSHVL